MPEGLIIGEKIGRTYHDDEEISVTDHEFMPTTTNPVDLMLGNDVEQISAGELDDLNIVEKGSANYGDFGKNDTHITQKPTTVEFVHIPSEVSDVTMTMGDNELESVESKLEGIVPHGRNDRAVEKDIVPSGGNDRVEENGEDTNKEDTSSKNNDHDTNKEDTPSKNNDHELRSDNVEETNRVPLHNHNLRPRKQRSYAHLFAQMGFKAGVKNFGARAEDAVLKEFSQLNDCNCLTPRSDLTKEEKKMALEYLMIIQEKRERRIKARGRADGRKQRGYLLKEEVSSSTATRRGRLLQLIFQAYISSRKCTRMKRFLLY